MKRITIPPVFAKDREFRELDNGNGKWTRAGYETELTCAQAIELKADASYYAEGPRGFDADMRGVCMSAKVLLQRLLP